MTLRKRRILLVIGVFGTANGGHTWTFKTIRDALVAHHDITVVEIGAAPSAQLGDIPAPNHYVQMDLLRPWRTLARLASIVRDAQPDLIHSFDARIDYFTTRLSNRFGLPLILTKCGGGTVRPQTFVADSVIAFTVQDRDLLAQGHGTGPRPTTLIPNRVSAFDCDAESIAELRARVPKGHRVILRISRINPTYMKSFKQGIALAKRLSEDGIDARFVLIGVVEDRNTLAALQAEGGAHLIVISDPRFTRNAKKVVDFGDVVIGTGRSLMEASCRGRVLLTMQAGSDLPVLVTPENFESLLATNFSPRNRASGFDPEENYAKIREVLLDEAAFQTRQNEARAYFSRYFDVKELSALYEKVYDGVGFKLKPLLRHLPIQLRKLQQARTEASRIHSVGDTGVPDQPHGKVLG